MPDRGLFVNDGAACAQHRLASPENIPGHADAGREIVLVGGVGRTDSLPHLNQAALTGNEVGDQVVGILHRERKVVAQSQIQRHSGGNSPIVGHESSEGGHGDVTAYVSGENLRKAFVAKIALQKIDQRGIYDVIVGIASIVEGKPPSPPAGAEQIGSAMAELTAKTKLCRPRVRETLSRA